MPSNPASLANCRHSRRFIRSGYGNAHWLIDFFMPYRLGEAFRESFAGWAAAEVVPAAARPPTPMANLKAERRDNSLPAGAGLPHGAVSFGGGSFCDGMELNCVRGYGTKFSNAVRLEARVITHPQPLGLVWQSVVRSERLVRCVATGGSQDCGVAAGLQELSPVEFHHSSGLGRDGRRGRRGRWLGLFSESPLGI